MTNQNFLDAAYFERLKTKALSHLKQKEHLFISLTGESSQFIRMNASKVRQIGIVNDANADFIFVLESPEGLKKSSFLFTLTGDESQDLRKSLEVLERLKKETAGLPVDPYAQLPQDHGSSKIEKKGELLSFSNTVDVLLKDVQNVDLAGLYSGGRIIRAMANSAGQSHWFSTETFQFDYSLYTPSQRAVKGLYAGTVWNNDRFKNEIAKAKENLKLLEQPSRKIERGAYRVYLAPAAVADIIGMFSWGCVSEAAIQQGDSPLQRMRRGEIQFSPRFTLNEDFRNGEVPRFNDEGELAPEVLPVIESGKLKNSLTSTRSAKEYNVASNSATASESLRSPVVQTGALKESDILKNLDTGLYLSNLHYLNWSDQPAGRITGMTRYACFWVEDGKIVAPLERMRFDDSIFNLLGNQLVDFTDMAASIPDTSTYGMRSLGSAWIPGALISKMEFTL